MKKSALAVLSLVLACAPLGASARQATPAAACTLPDVAPSTVRSAVPLIPALAQHFGVSGSVVVAVTIDERGKLLDASIARSPVAMFDRPALDVVRATTFAPGRKACQTYGGKFAYVVDFAPEGTPSPPLVDPLAYFPGSWRCSTNDLLSLETFERDPGQQRLFHTATPAPKQSLTQGATRVWRLSDGAGLDAEGYPWIDPQWTFTTNDRTIVYERIDERTFVRTTTVGIPNGIRTTTRCVKIST